MAAEEASVLAFISKRLRTHRKKYNRITLLEESLFQGKTLNKDQEEIIRSKPIVTALIDELVKLRLPPPPPPSTAVSEENKQKQKEMAEEKNIEDCKIVDGLNSDEVSNDGLNSDEVSNDNTSLCNGSSQGVACSRKSRRKQNAKKRQTLERVIVSPTSVLSESLC